MEKIEITTQTGRLIGISGKKSNRFLGVPFAVPPIGDHRFKRAKAAPKDNHLIDCTRFKFKAFQPKAGALNIENDILQSEDCLYLNIWTPKNNSGEKPVVVWIHGGAFIMGETSHKIYDGENFAVNGNIIFVSIQYRLGVFGFMDFSYLNNDKYIFETNIGLSDQIEALKWIQDNIGYFGGDKFNITVMGESAGATSILSLMASPKSKNLFHKAICQSAVLGSVLSKENARFWAEKAISYMGFAKNLPESLMNVSPDLAVEATAKINKIFTEIMPGSWPIGPVIDNDIITSTIIDAYQNDIILNIPLLLGTNKDEAANFIREIEPWLPSNEKQVNLMFALNPDINREKVLSKYSSFPSVQSLRDMGRDMCFVSGNTKVADLNSKKNATYVYRFDYETRVTKKMNLGAFHGMEIMFAFNNLEAELLKIVALDLIESKQLANVIHNYWLNFIKYSSPNSLGLANWNKYTDKTRETMLLELNTQTVTNPDRNGYELWKNINLYT